jgi:hypothetical protein
VLSACSQLFSAAPRIITFARLQSLKPLDAAPRGAHDFWGRLRRHPWGRFRPASLPGGTMQQPVWAVNHLEYSAFAGIGMNAAQLKAQIEQGEYQIDPLAVADAMLRRWRGLAQSSPQNECSYPDSSTSASTKATPGSPATTKPTHVRLVPRLNGLRAFLSFAAARAGMHAHSS